MSVDTPRTCLACAHRLRPGTCGEPVAAGLAESFGIYWAPKGHAETCPAFRPSAAMPSAKPARKGTARRNPAGESASLSTSTTSSEPGGLAVLAAREQPA